MAQVVETYVWISYTFTWNMRWGEEMFSKTRSRRPNIFASLEINPPRFQRLDFSHRNLLTLLQVWHCRNVKAFALKYWIFHREIMTCRVWRISRWENVSVRSRIAHLHYLAYYQSYFSFVSFLLRRIFYKNSLILYFDLKSYKNMCTRKKLS